MLKKSKITRYIFVLFSLIVCSSIFAQTNNNTPTLKDEYTFKESAKEIYDVLNNNSGDLKDDENKIPVFIIAKDPLNQKVLWEISNKMASYLKQLDKNKNLLAIIDRQHIKEILKENKLKESALFKENESFKLAEFLSAKIIIFIDKKENKYQNPFFAENKYYCNVDKVSNTEKLSTYEVTKQEITPFGWGLIILFSLGILAFIIIKVQDSLQKDAIICPICGKKNPLKDEKGIFTHECSGCKTILFQ